MSQKKKKDRTPNVPTGTAPQQPAAASGSKGSSSTAVASTKPAAKRSSQRERQRRQNRMMLIGGGVIAVLVVAGLILLNSRGQAAATPPAASNLPAELVSGSTKGDPNAQVKVAVYSDFECPACKSFAESFGRQVDEQYVKTGKILFEYKHYPLPQHEPGATYAANAAECAADQGKFWEMHDYLFQEQGKQGAQTFTLGRLRSMGEALGLDTGNFNSCLSRQEFQEKITADTREARQLGVNATPTFFVNGQYVDLNTGGFQALLNAIDAALSQAGQS